MTQPGGRSRPRGAAGSGQTYGSLLYGIAARLRAAGCPEPGIEARLLLQHTQGITTERLLSALGKRAPAGAADAVEPLVARRIRREPLPYITGNREFYGRRFSVDSRVLVPRPETELLVERALEFASAFGHPRGDGLMIADICTGSGILAITLALEMPHAGIVATDISADALDAARVNAEALGAARRVEWLLGDAAGPLRGRFNIVVSNPPYVPTAALDAGEPELAFEPRIALDGGPDGLDVIRRVIQALPRALAGSHSVALIEVDPRSSGPAAALARRTMPSARVEVLPDLAGLDRCIEVRTVSDS